MRAERIYSCVHRDALPERDLEDANVTVFSPMGLNDHGVDLFEIDGAGLVAHGFDYGRQAEIAS